IREIIGAIIAIAGAFLINFETDNLLIFGTLIALLAAFIIAVQEFIGKIYVARIKPVVLASMRTTFTLPFLLVFAASTGSISTVSSGNLTLIIIGSTLSAAIGFIFWYKALETTDVSKAAIIRTLDPFIVLAYAFMIFRTTPKIPELIGGTLIVAGVILSELRLGKVKDALKILPL
ncbi:DMT family transporter, partial [Candidatus Woesearchaeota archaeon]|nr:DMT family transporter [Candidatus Woesearchaeota archaeon]